MSSHTFSFRMSKTNRERYSVIAEGVEGVLDGTLFIGFAIRRKWTTSSPRGGVDNATSWIAKTQGGKVIGSNFDSRAEAAAALAAHAGI